MTDVAAAGRRGRVGRRSKATSCRSKSRALRLHAWKPARRGCRSPTRERPARRFPPFQGHADGRRLHAVSRVFGVEICHARAPGRGARRACRRASTKRSTKSPSTPRPTRCARWRGWRSGRPAQTTDAMIAGIAAGDRGLPRLRRFHPRAAALVPRRVYGDRRSPATASSASTRPSSAIATGWMNPATTCSGISPKTTRCCSTPRPISPDICCPKRAFAVPAGSAREQSAVGAGARARLARSFRDTGKWPSSTRRPISRSTSRALTRSMRWRPTPTFATRAGDGDRPPAGNRRALRASGRAHRRAGPLLRAHAARRAARWSCPASAACCGARATTACASMRCRSLRSAFATMACAVPDELAGDRLLAARRRAGMVLRAGPGPHRQALPLQDPRLRDGHAPPPIAGTSGAIRRRCCICGSATIRTRRSGSIIPARRSSPAMAGRPIGAARGTLPRVHQYRGLAVVAFDCAAEQPDFTHAWFPRSAFDEVARRRRRRARPRRRRAW